ncbi:pyrroline-5-carboxylate reductase [uncultured Faecalicoccus sp.]|uniref:pyrroline-5-carboxylate reductase n=1 Tax=uncultured Faecalicoccus sp. TaxID=1971760 RepID=UPI0026089EE0|nr:pyrroline-5-carboxylate reductase [uncultured Faecalicoccus sp.]
MKIGFIGFGNMARAIVQGLIEKGGISPDTIHVCAAHYELCRQNADRLKVHAYPLAQDVVEHADMIVLAVKPYQVQEVVKPIRERLKKKVVVSIAAGCFFDDYEKILCENTHHISAIPNTPIAIGQGILIVEGRHSLSDEEYQEFVSIFERIALIETIDTEHVSIATTIAGCAPAYTAMYLEALGDAGVKHGLKRDQAYALAAQMIKGTGALYIENQVHPGMMKDAVCSPGGTTIKGVASLEKNAFRGIVIEAIDEVEKKL